MTDKFPRDINTEEERDGEHRLRRLHMMDEYFDKKVSEKIKNAQKELEASKVKHTAAEIMLTAAEIKHADAEIMLAAAETKLAAAVVKLKGERAKFDAMAKYHADAKARGVYDDAAVEELDAMFSEAKAVIAGRKQLSAGKKCGAPHDG
ncbi:MAG: hypothetical protein LBP95_04130 [Deltaproteobacteria bacterium]|jgi:hypothetical protein|nr:hypothetical protein [Deltaproteobacteria bacterium]